MRMRPRRLRDFTRFCSAECEESQQLSFIFEDLEDRMKAREESIKETKTKNCMRGFYIMVMFYIFNL